LADNNPQVITFFSPRTVQAFFKNKQESIDLNKYVIAVLARSSALELKKFGYQTDITAKIPTAENLLHGIKKYYE
jgi:uroporphyrinogen-III synthase